MAECGTSSPVWGPGETTGRGDISPGYGREKVVRKEGWGEERTARGRKPERVCGWEEGLRKAKLTADQRTVSRQKAAPLPSPFWVEPTPHCRQTPTAQKSTLYGTTIRSPASSLINTRVLAITHTGYTQASALTHTGHTQADALHTWHTS